MKPDPSRPWKVLEPFTDAVVAQCVTEDEARQWIHGARIELRNGGHIPPQYTVRNAGVALPSTLNDSGADRCICNQYPHTNKCVTRGVPACRKCGGAMKPGKAMAQTVDCSDEGTCSPAGPGKLIDCMKCEKCGWSVTAGVKGGGDAQA